MTSLLFVAPNDEKTRQRVEEMLNAAGISFKTYESDDAAPGIPILFDEIYRLDGLEAIVNYLEWRVMQARK